MMILGNRIPYEYIITKGKGESSAGSEGLPYETGSYDAALNVVSDNERTKFIITFKI